MEKIIYINIRKTSKYGQITSLDISKGSENKILTAYTSGEIGFGKKFIDQKSMLIAGASFVDLKNVGEIVTGTPRELYHALCELNSYGTLEDIFDPKITKIADCNVSLTKLIKTHKGQGKQGVQDTKSVDNTPKPSIKQPKQHRKNDTIVDTNTTAKKQDKS